MCLIRTRLFLISFRNLAIRPLPHPLFGVLGFLDARDREGRSGHKEVVRRRGCFRAIEKVRLILSN
jgi:hypothetical protein